MWELWTLKEIFENVGKQLQQIKVLAQCCVLWDSIWLFGLYFQGKLVGHGVEDKMPTIAIVAHYDSFGIAPVSCFSLL